MIISAAIICIIGGAFRIIGIDSLITGFYVDEASIAYNAKSIWETGSDEYGQKWPIAFRSFGEYKSPLLIYSAVPLVSWLGEVSGLRLTSAIFGTLTIALVGYYAWLVTERISHHGKNRWLATLITMAIMAWSPWHINLSRHGIEAVLAVFLSTASLVFIAHKKYAAALLTLFLSTTAYNSLKYTAPIMVLFVIFLAYKDGAIRISKQWIAVLLAWLVGIAILCQPFSNTRAMTVMKVTANGNPVREVLSTYISYLSPRSLVIGDWQLRNNIAELDNLFIWMVLGFYIGLVVIIRNLIKQRWSRDELTLLLWLALAILPASMTIDPFHAIRALPMMVPLSVISGIGYSFMLPKSGTLKRLILAGGIILLAGEAILIMDRILSQNSVVSFNAWIGGYSELIKKTMALDASQYRQIVVDNTDEPAVYSLWQVYGKVDTRNKITVMDYYTPREWSGPDSLVLGNGMSVTFRPVYWPMDRAATNSVFVGPQTRFDLDDVEEAGGIIIDRVSNPERKDVWLIVKSSSIPKESVK